MGLAQSVVVRVGLEPVSTDDVAGSIELVKAIGRQTNPPVQDVGSKPLQ
jgi:hypothetical protein